MMLIGSVRAARSAGAAEAASPQRSRMTVTAVSESGSAGPTPKSIERRSLAAASAPPRPMAVPTRTSARPRDTTSAATWRAVAPSAIRTPISRSRREVT
jgi:hypothetical protein